MPIFRKHIKQVVLQIYHAQHSWLGLIFQNLPVNPLEIFSLWFLSLGGGRGGLYISLKPGWKLIVLNILLFVAYAEARAQGSSFTFITVKITIPLKLQPSRSGNSTAGSCCAIWRLLWVLCPTGFLYLILTFK